MSDLRESGSIEQDSDIAMFLLRREYYDPIENPGTAEMIVAKNRHGASAESTSPTAKSRPVCQLHPGQIQRSLKRSSPA